MKKLVIPTIIFIMTLLLLIFSAFKVILWHLDNKDIESEVKLIQKITPIEVITETNEEEVEEEEYLSVDFKEITNLNNEVVAWINIPNTSINYPVLKHKDNSYYLNHSFDKSKNNAGWIFLDYRNSLSELGSNTIIYGHNRLDGSMFGSLNNLTKSEYLNNEVDHLIYLSTPNYNYVFEIFSLYRIDTTDDYIQVDFKDNEFEDWLTMIQKRSIYNFNVTPNKDDKIITLSTCYKHVKKLVVHGRLIRTQIRE